MEHLAFCLERSSPPDQAKREEAERIRANVLESRRRIQGPEAALTRQSFWDFANLNVSLRQNPLTREPLIGISLADILDEGNKVFQDAVREGDRKVVMRRIYGEYQLAVFHAQRHEEADAKLLYDRLTKEIAFVPDETAKSLRGYPAAETDLFGVARLVARARIPLEGAASGIASYREVLDRSRRLLGAEDSHVMRTARELAGALKKEGDAGGACATLTGLMSGWVPSKERLSPDKRQVVFLAAQIAPDAAQAGQSQAAAAMLRELSRIHAAGPLIPIEKKTASESAAATHFQKEVNRIYADGAAADTRNRKRLLNDLLRVLFDHRDLPQASDMRDRLLEDLSQPDSFPTWKDVLNPPVHGEPNPAPLRLAVALASDRNRERYVKFCERFSRQIDKNDASQSWQFSMACSFPDFPITKELNELSLDLARDTARNSPGDPMAGLAYGMALLANNRAVESRAVLAAVKPDTGGPAPLLASALEAIAMWMTGSDREEAIDLLLETQAASRLVSATRSGDFQYQDRYVLDRILVQGWRLMEGASHIMMHRAYLVTGEVLLQQGDAKEAVWQLREATRIIEETFPDAWRAGRARSLLGSAQCAANEQTEGEKNLISGYRILIEHQSDLPPDQAEQMISQAAMRLANFYEAIGKPDVAAKWKQTPEE